MAKKVITTVESETGRNLVFKDQQTGDTMTRAQFVRQIERGERSDYHVRVINGIKTPVSNPDGSSGNNLD